MIMDNRVREIIKYNSSRKYFGDWSPKQLHEAYQTTCRDEEGKAVSLKTGIISVDDICNTLWTEMSYNPLRFGEKSPFVFDNANSIKLFSTSYKFNDLNPDTNALLGNIKGHLKYFLSLIEKHDALFEKTGCTESQYVSIKLQDHSCHPNNAYKMLAQLAGCIHMICKQNLQDYNKSVKSRFTIDEVCRNRHPDLKREIKNPCFSRIEYLTGLKDSLLQQISYKNVEILNTQMCIESLSEYENPADTSHQQELLEKQNQDLHYLDIRLQQIQQEISTLIR
jgi:hypothetical protein